MYTSNTRVVRLKLPFQIGTLLQGIGLLFGMLLLAACAAATPPSTNFNYEGTELEEPAPDFQLVGQHGDSVSLSDFRGKVVLLAFLDPYCTDVCPLTASQFRQVGTALESNANSVVYLAVNTNPDANTVADAVAATEKWGMDDVATWHFLIGDVRELESVWDAYHVTAGAPKPEKPGEVEHSPGLYVIDQQGQKRWYVSLPFWDADLPPLHEVLLKHVRALL